MRFRSSDWVNIFAAASLIGVASWIVWSTRPVKLQLATSRDNPSVSQSAEPATLNRSRKLDEATWEQRVVPHLERCRLQIEESAPRHLEPIVELLNYARNRTPKFSSVAFSFESKWKTVNDYVPFAEGGNSETFLRERFETLVLKGEDLEKAVERSVQDFLQELASIEGQMLVDLRADLADLPESPFVNSTAQAQIQSSFDKTVQTTLEKTNSDFQGAVGSQLASLIAGEVLAHVAIRMGVSAGILGTGAASGWATFGVGVLAGFVVDAIVSTAWNYWASPEQELTRQVQRQFDTLQRLLLDGDSASGKSGTTVAPLPSDNELEDLSNERFLSPRNLGLRGYLNQIATERTEARRIALRELLMESP